MSDNWTRTGPIHRAIQRLSAFKSVFARLRQSESGADVIEYAMLGVFMALLGVVLLNGITAMIGNTFVRFGTVLTGSV